MDNMEFESEANESITNSVDKVILPLQEESQELQEDITEGTSHIEEEHKEKLVRLPLGRVKYIMKSDPDTEIVSQDAVFLITKSTELFIDSLAKEAYKYTAQNKKKTIQKQDICSAIDNVDCLVFLDGIFK